LFVALASYGVWLYCRETDARSRIQWKLFMSTAALTLTAFAVLGGRAL
jgi:uncharacterized membrane protein